VQITQKALMERVIQNKYSAIQREIKSLFYDIAKSKQLNLTQMKGI
jgi:hypothetical protein